MRRLASRVLLVFGGTVAATAAAWAISSATASADTVDHVDAFSQMTQEVPVVDRVVSDVVAPVLQQVEGALTNPAKPEDVKRAAEEVFTDFGRHFTERFNPVPDLPVDEVELPVISDLTPIADSAADQAPPAPVVAPAPVIAPVRVSTVEHLAPAPSDRSVPGGVERRGPPAPLGGLPDLPSPLTVPSHGSNGQSGNGHTDAPTFGVVSGGLLADGPTAAGVLRPVSAHVPVTTGDQPGVTPD